MGGLTIGIFWGLIVSAVVLAAVSLSSPLPPRPGEGAGAEGAVEAEVTDVATEVAAELMPEQPAGDAVPDAEADAPAPVPGDDATAGPQEADAVPDADATAASGPATDVPLPSGSEFNRPPPEPEAALPAPDAAPSVSAPQAPQGTTDITTPQFDTAPAAQPNVGTDAPAAISVQASGATDTPTPPNADGPAPVVGSGPVALSTPDTSPTPQIRTGLLPQIAEPEPAEPASPTVSADPEPVQLETPTFPTITSPPVTGMADGAGPQTPELPDDTGGSEAVSALGTPGTPATPGLPQILPAPGGAAGGVADGDADADTPAAPDGAVRAIEAFAAPFDAREDRPLMAVILIDDPDTRIEQSTLTRFTFPVAFAVDPQRPDAAERAQVYRDAGFEVVIFATMIPDGATASDTEVSLSGAQDILSEAVAVLDTPEGHIQGNRAVLDAVVGALQETGHGLVAFPQGLNAAEQSANRVGVPGATVFRLLDDEDQRATVITRFLSRAAFSAAQEDTVIVVGRTRPDTVTALFSWALGDRSEAVALAPLSAALLRAAGR